MGAEKANHDAFDTPHRGGFIQRIHRHDFYHSDAHSGDHMRARPVPLGLLLFFTLLTSAPVWADGFIAPFIGDNVGGNAGKCTTITSCSSTHLTYGVAVGAMSAGVIGVEEDIG